MSPSHSSTPLSHSSSDAIPVEIDASLEELIPTFLQNRRVDVETLTQALAAENFVAIQHIGHRLHGDGGGYGFAEIGELGATLEAAAPRRDHDCIAQQIARLTDYLNRVSVTYKS